MHVVLETMIPVLAIVAVGFAIEGRAPIQMASLSQLALLVCSPALIFSELARAQSASADGLTIIAATLFIMAFTGAVAAISLRWLPGRPRGLILPIMFWNAGNLGLSISRLARGDEGFELATLAFVTVAATQALLSGWIASGRFGGRQLLTMPIAWAAILGITCSLTQLQPPPLVMEPIGMLGEAAIPLLLVVLGMQLRRLRLERPLAALYASFCRSAVGFLAAFLVVEFCALDGVLRDVLFIESIMPPAVISLMFAQRYDANPDDVASAIVGGTVVALVALPLLLTWL